MALNLDALLRIKADVVGENNIRRLGNSLQGLEGKAKNLGLNMKALGATLVGSAIIGSLTAIVKKSIDAGDELFNLQAKTGVAANQLIGIGNAAKLADVDVGTLGKGLTKLNVNLVKAAEGNEDLGRQFKSLGVSVKDANGQVVPADKALKQIADRFADMPDGAQKAAAAVALFGKSGADLIPLLNEGAASMEKFTYKIGEDFAARSDLFNDTITEFGIKTQGFGLELTDALLPALQSILEVFGDLFNTEQDWTALFGVITTGLRLVATFVYATIKLVDQWIKTIVFSFDAVGKALKGDFAGAGKAISDGVGSGIEQAKRDFAEIQKIFTDSPTPGTGRRTRGTNPELDTTSADAKAAAASRRAASAAAREAEKMQERYNTALKRGAKMADDLKRKTRDLQLDTAALGATGAEAIKLNYNSALNDVGDEVEDLRKQINDLMQMTGGSVKFEGLRNIAKDYLLTRKKKVDESYEQGLKDLLPSLAEYDAKIAEVTRGKRKLNEVEKLNAEITLKGLDIVAQSNPKQAERNRLLREQAARLDEVTAKQKADSESIGAGIQQRLQDYYNSVKDLGGAIGDAVVGGLQGLEDQLTAFVTTGKANFKELATSILSDLARIAIRAAIIQPIVKALGGLFPGFQFADGGVFAQNGIQKFAMGGVVNRPTIFPFANGTGLMGEAGPEAIMPLQRGANGKLGVIASGGGNTSVVVNVDASGNSNVQGDQAQAKQLGVVVSAAVQAELVKQQRPGGLLAGTRR